MTYTIYNLIDDIITNIIRDCEDGVLTKEALKDRLLRFSEVIKNGDIDY